MTLIEYCEDLSSGFKDKDKVFFRLDSIAYTGFNNGVRAKNLRNQLSSISEIAKLYENQEIYVLSMVDKFYSEAVKNRNSVLYRDIRVKANTFGRILGRIKKHRDDYNKLIEAEDLALIFEQEVLRSHELKNADKKGKTHIRRFRVYHQRIKS